MGRRKETAEQTGTLAHVGKHSNLYTRHQRQTTEKTAYRMEQIARLRALGMTIAEVARHMELSKTTIEKLTVTEEYEKISARMREKAFEQVDALIQQRKAMEILEDCSGEAAEALVRILRDTDDDVERRMAATAILDRAGYGPVQRRAIRQRIELDPVMAKVFKDALAESARSESGPNEEGR